MALEEKAVIQEIKRTICNTVFIQLDEWRALMWLKVSWFVLCFGHCTFSVLTFVFCMASYLKVLSYGIRQDQMPSGLLVNTPVFLGNTDCFCPRMHTCVWPCSRHVSGYEMTQTLESWGFTWGLCSLRDFIQMNLRILKDTFKIFD